MKFKGITRRRFLQSSVCGVALGSGIGWSLFQAPSAGAQVFIRPPGALAEDEFSAACIRCGLCVQVCPYDTLRLFDHDGSAQVGTPYFVARDIPCEMCPDIPCVQACPTGALDPDLTDIRQAEMGTASLTHPELCNSYIGASYCDSCYQACPLRDEAIYMKIGPTDKRGYFTPTVNPDVCTGCGKCEQACIAHEAAIRVIPSHV